MLTIGLVDVKGKGRQEMGASDGHVDGCKFYLTDKERNIREQH